MHRDTKPNGTGRRNTEPNILNTFLSDKNLGKDELKGRIDSEIMRVEDNIVKLVMQRAVLKRRRNALSPAVNLPPEILALIFEHACSPNGNGNELEYRYDYPLGEGEGPSLAVAGERGGRGRWGGTTNLGISVGAGAVTPLFIGTICSAWRHVSQNTTQLWDTVTVFVNNRRAASQATLLRTWLKRSGQRPLTIKLLEDEEDGDGYDNDNFNDADWGIDVTSLSIIDALAAHSQQWHTIDVFLPSTWKATLAKIKHALPILTNATLRAAEACPSLSRVDAFSNVPQLREVRLVGYSVTDVLLPWAQLERLDGEYFSPGECLDTLHLGSKLRTCQFEQLYRGVHPFVVRPIRHECLESFELIMDATHSYELEALFGALTLPNLTELVLSLCNEDDDAESILRNVIPLMKRSMFKLRRLHLVGVTPEEEELIGFLRELPTLKALLLINPMTETGGTLSKRFLDDMMPPTKTKTVGEEDDSCCLTPLLEHLEYQGATSFSSQALTELLVSRWRVGLQIEDNNNNAEEPLRSTSTRNADPHENVHSDEAEEIESLPTPSPRPPSHSHSQLHSVIITTTKKIKFNFPDAQTVQNLIGEGMHLDFLVDINGPFI